MQKLLSIGADPKTAKGDDLGYMTGIVYLSPHESGGGENLCPNAENAGCIASCLYYSGHGATPSVQHAREQRTQLFNTSREVFMYLLMDEIEALQKRAKKAGLTPCVRLNGTSDIRYEAIKVTYKGKKYRNIFAAFPDLQFYDYTKVPRRSKEDNYYLVFSYSEAPEYQASVRKAIRLGMNLTVVWEKESDIPKKFLGRKVINGDKHDLRFRDPPNSIVALTAKRTSSERKQEGVQTLFIQAA